MLTDLDSEVWRKSATRHQVYMSVLWNDHCPYWHAILGRNNHNKRNKNEVRKICFMTFNFRGLLPYPLSCGFTALVLCKFRFAISTLWLVRRSLLSSLIGATGLSSSALVPPSLEPTLFKPAEALARGVWLSRQLSSNAVQSDLFCSKPVQALFQTHRLLYFPVWSFSF